MVKITCGPQRLDWRTSSRGQFCSLEVCVEEGRNADNELVRARISPPDTELRIFNARASSCWRRLSLQRSVRYEICKHLYITEQVQI